MTSGEDIRRRSAILQSPGAEKWRKIRELLKIFVGSFHARAMRPKGRDKPSFQLPLQLAIHCYWLPLDRKIPEEFVVTRVEKDATAGYCPVFETLLDQQHALACRHTK
ncbi:hypothetical protein AAMO2058_000121500 [Amorphochlora amoebiformis]